MEAVEMIDRYVHEVGQSLPRSKRDDIQLELRSLLLDDLEERAGDKEPTAESASKLLLEYGKPEAMAAKYKPDQYLIGPKLFPFYRMIILIVLAAVSFGLFVSFVIAFVAGGMEDIISKAWSFLSAIFQAGLSAFAGITIVFAIIERVPGDKIGTKSDEEWNPYDLKAVDEKNRTSINKPGLVASIVAYLFFIILFNFYPQWLMVVESLEPEATVIPLLAPEFAVFIPYFTAYWSLMILHKLFLMWRGRWEKSSRWMEFGLGLFSLYITYQLATGGPITTMAWVDMFIRFGLWIGIIVGTIEAVAQLFRLLSGEPRKPSGTISDLKTST